MTRSVGKPPNSQYYELCTCFKEIPTHESMFRAVCVQPPHPPPISCVSISFVHSTFWSFGFFFLPLHLFQLLFVQLTKEANSPRILFLCQHNLTHTHTPVSLVRLLYVKPPDPPYYISGKDLNPLPIVFGKNYASPSAL